MLVAVIAGLVYGRIPRDRSDAACFAGEAAVILLVGGFGLPWSEFAPDGAFRRRDPQT
jgi:hypothetical protein